MFTIDENWVSDVDMYTFSSGYKGSGQAVSVARAVARGVAGVVVVAVGVVVADIVAVAVAVAVWRWWG